jgi:tripartite-type tricarboxylate transporter receptor subunit TctC
MSRPAHAALATGALVVFLHAPGFAAESAKAAGYPDKPVRMIVPLAPGGGSDIVGRIAAQALTEHWRKSVVVDNRPGAGSAVGTSIAAKAAPDGYTMLVSSSSIAITPALYKNLAFDVTRDFVPVTLIASQPSILVVHPSVKAASVQELVALSNSTKLAYASAGVGSATHLGTELLLYTARAQMLHVPYKSAGLATSAVLAGETQVLLTNMASVLPHVGSGKLRAIGVSSAKRSPVAPQIPTLSESGLAGFDYATWYGMLMPKGTPAAIVGRVHTSIAEVVKKPDVAERFSSQGLQTFASPPAEFDRYLRAEIDRWARVVRSAEISVE